MLITSKPIHWAEVDEQGRLVVPPEIADRYGLRPGAKVRLEDGENHIRLHRPVTQLAKVYIEPTNRCNLDCRTCMRNVWDEPLGQMSEETFARILENAHAISPRPTIHFGGLGEPLFHPRTIGWIAQAKSTGAKVEVITNGTLLTAERSRELIDSGLDVLWVSIDGATPESYADVRLGATLPQVVHNLRRLRKMRRGSHHPRPEIGIAFVAMKRNIHELPAMLALGRSLDAKYFKVSNVLPYTEELRGEVLYQRVLSDITYLPSPWLRHLSLPKMEINDLTQDALLKALRSGYNVTFAGNNLGGANDVCTFIESGSITLGWDGTVSPCPPLLHTHVHYLNNHWHRVQRHALGNIAESELLDIWNEPEYVAYRERVQSFAFAPCTFCGGGELLDANEEDCMSNVFPACGSCLWAQAVIQCP